MNALPITPMTLECISGHVSSLDVWTHADYDPPVCRAYRRFTAHCERCVVCRLHLFGAMCRSAHISFLINSKGHYIYVGSMPYSRIG